MHSHVTSRIVFQHIFSPISLAYVLIGLSASLSAYYGFLNGSRINLFLAVVLGSVGLFFDLAKPFAVKVASEHTLGATKIAAVAIALGCMAYSLSSELGLQALAHGDLAASRGQQVQSRLSRSDQFEADKGQLATAKQDKLWARTSGCTNATAPASVAFCSNVAHIQADLAKNQDALNTSPAVSAADPLASMLAFYSTQTGHTVDEATVMPWTNLVLPLVLEVASAFGLLVFRSNSPLTTTYTSIAQESPETSLGTRLDNTDQGPSKCQSNLIQVVSGHGGTVQMSQRELALAMGVSKTRVGQVLKEMVESGLVTATTSSLGTTIKLVAAA